MTHLQSLAKSLLPDQLRDSLRAMHREFAFRRAMRRFLARPEAGARPDSRILRDLVYGWGNESWSAMPEYLADCIRHALTTPGPILECGSGLSTLLIGAIAKRRGQAHWALEHLPEWAAKVQGCLDRYDLGPVILHVDPLKDHGSFRWYDPPLASMPASFSLVICDGPPGGTKGGRYGLVPIMKDRLEPGCIILLDDAGREQEFAVAKQWETELGASLEPLGAGKPYIKLTIPGRRRLQSA